MRGRRSVRSEMEWMRRDQRQVGGEREEAEGRSCRHTGGGGEASNRGERFQDPK